MPAVNSVAWFEIGTDDPAKTQTFFNEVFGWTLLEPANPYGIFKTPGGEGGIADTKGEIPNYAIFTVLVEDVEATCRQVEKAGGAVRGAPQVTPDGLAFAYVTDPSGNQFGIFTPPAQP